VYGDRGGVGRTAISGRVGDHDPSRNESTPACPRVASVAPEQNKGRVHVFAQEGGAGLELTVERFTTDGPYRGSTVVDTASALNLTLHAIDAGGRLCLPDTRDAPQHPRHLAWETAE
jgi:hypothetical protein